MEQDSHLLLNILPDDVWILLFDTMATKNLNDEIENTINSSMYLRSLVNSKRSTLLFPKVFAVLAPKYENEKDSCYEEPERPINPSEDDGVTLSQVPRKQAGVVKLRQVCKAWRNNVDDYYQKKPDHYEISHDSNSHYIKKKDHFSNYGVIQRHWSDEYFISDDHENTLKFLELFKNIECSKIGSRCPFISKRITIGTLKRNWWLVNLNRQEVGELNPIYYNAIDEILDRFGEGIWYCEILTCDQFPSRVEYYRKLHHWLNLMPNLKLLSVSYFMQVPDTKYPTVSELSELQREISENPLPILKKLKCLKTCKLPSPIFNELVRQNADTITTLQVTKNKWQNDYQIFSTCKPLVHLKQLAVRFESKDEKLFQLKNLSLDCKLEKLHLDYYIETRVDWSSIFGIASNWSATLTNLVISLPCRNRDGYFNKQKDNLSSLILYTPNVKRFKLLLRSSMPIDFMLSLRDSLENFVVCLVDEISTEEKEMDELARSCSKQIIQFVGYEGRLVCSNIWQLFPKLKNIHVYDDYEKHTQIYKRNSEISRKMWQMSCVKYYPRLH